MMRFLSCWLALLTGLFICDPIWAQQQAMDTVVLQKLNEIENRLNDMDKRYEIRFANIEAEFKRIEVKIDAVNTRIDDKFNLIVGLLGLVVAILALPYLPKFFERYKANSENKKEILQLQEQIDQIKVQLTQRVGPAQ